MERILFPSAVKMVIGALNAQLPALGQAGVQASSQVPATRPAKFVRVYRTGGPRVNIVTDSAQLTAEAWASTGPEAETLANAVRAIIGGLEGTVTGGVTVYGVNEFSGPADLPDPSSTQVRYTWTVSVNVRGVAA